MSGDDDSVVFGMCRSPTAKVLLTPSLICRDCTLEKVYIGPACFGSKSPPVAP